MKINKEDIKNDLVKVKEILSKIPSQKEYKQHGKYGFTTIDRRFGTWNKALLETLGECHKIKSIPKKEIECPKCGKKFIANFNGKKYCSVACSNSMKPRRKKSTHPCHTCGDLITIKRKYCKKCVSIGKHLSSGKLPVDKTIRESLYKNDANKYTKIRVHARSVMKKEPQVCKMCEYNKHVEVCHIKDISDFDLETKISVVNHPSNLALLCPNCHWEFDHGELNIDGGPVRT